MFRTLKILHVIDSGGLYGAEVMLLNLMVEQKKLGHTPVLCSINSEVNCDNDIEKTAKSLKINVEALNMRPGLNLWGAHKIVKLAKSIHADILHSHGYKPNILLTLYPKALRNIPVVSTTHGWTNTKVFSKLSLYEWLDTCLLKYKDAVVVVCKQMLNHPNIVSGRIPASRLHVISNGISAKPFINTYDENSFNSLQDFARGAYLIGSVGRLSSEKGYDSLIEAVKLLRDNGQNVKLILIGEGPLRSSLHKKTSSLKLDEYIRFTGYLENARDYMNLFDVYVISSLTEGLPITMLEAMYEKVPIISTGVGGIPDIIEHDNSGILISQSGSREIADAINNIMNNPDTARKYTDEAHKRVQSEYSCSVMANAYNELYRGIIETGE